MTLHIQLLGNFTLTLNDVPCNTVNSVRLQSLLAYLLIHRNAPQQRQHLAFQLWPDSSEEQARNNLRKTLHQLRRRLPDADQFLQIDTRTVQWNPDAPYVLDVAEFELKVRRGAALASDPAAQQAAWEEAVVLYGGELLRPCYDEWIVPERERLHQAFLDTLESLVQLAEEQRQYPVAIRYANRLLRHDPLHEATYARLMRLHALHGDRARALQTYQLCATILRRELDVEPGAQIQRAHARLLAQDESAVPSFPPSPAPAGHEHLVGREEAWLSLQAAWDRASQGAVHFCLIRGEAGIGKTRLAEELLMWAARQGFATARTRAYAAAGDLVYAPVMEWLRSEALRPSLASLDPVWLTEVARLLPELLAEHPHLTPPEPWQATGPGQWQRHRLFEALTRALLVDSQPRLLQIDDLQWCDGETLAWLHYLFRFVQGTALAQDETPPLLIVATVRPGEVDGEHPLTPLRLELLGNPAFTEVDLEPLHAEGTTALAEQVTRSELAAPVAAALHRYTGGNPLFVVETVQSADWRTTVEAADGSGSLALLHQARPALPERVQRVIQARLAQLSPTAQKLASLAAVIGRSFTVELLCWASEDAEATVLHSLEELWQRHLVQAQGKHVYDFSHDRIRDATLESISPILRPQLHQRVAAALEAIHAADLEPVSAQLAAHYEQAGAWESAIDCYQQAAHTAHLRFADASAVDLLYRALELIKNLPSTRLHQERELSILQQISQPIVVTRGFFAPVRGEISTRACALAQELAKPGELFYALGQLRAFRQMCGDYSVAQELAEQMLSLAEELSSETISPATDDAKRLLEAHHALAHALMYTGKLNEAQSHYDQALSLHQPTSGLLIFSATNLWLLGYPDRARWQMHRSLVVARRLRHPHEIGFAMTNLARLNYFLRRLRLTAFWAQKSIAHCVPFDISSWISLSKLYSGTDLGGNGRVSTRD